MNRDRRGNAGGLRILLADDNDDLRQMLAEALTLEGFDVLEVRTGDDAFATTIGEAPDVIVVDFRMPGIDGAEVVRGLRRLHYQVAAILISANDLRSEAMALGVPFLQKPLSMEDLCKLLWREAERTGTG